MGSDARRLVAAFFLVQLLFSAYFNYYRPNVNATSRVLPVVSLVERGSLDITIHERWTGDKSYVDGRYYSDKAPLSTFVVVPFYALLRWTGALPPVGDRFERTLPVFVLGDFLCGALPFALLVTLTFASLLRLELASGIPRTLLASLPFYGSFLFLYAGLFYGHLLAALLLLLSWIALRAPGIATVPDWRDWRDAAAGGLVGLAVLAEYPAAVVLPAWILHLLRFRARRLRSLVVFGLGGLPFLALLLLHNASVTGSPFRMPYEFEVLPDFQVMEQAFGLHLPSPRELCEALWGLLLSPFRGLAVFAPSSLLLAVVCVRQMGVGRQLLGHTLLHAAVLYLGLISCYYMWWGGWAYGPRHLAPAVALLFFAGAGLLARSRVSALAFYGLGTLGLVFALAAKATVGHRMPPEFPVPLWELVLPRVLEGHFNPYNLASLWLGAPPAVAVAIWAVLFVGAMMGLARWERRALGHVG